MAVRDHSGKVVVVTGAGSGIGQAIARSFGRRGARLVLADINPDALAGSCDEFDAMGCRTVSRVVDVRNPDDVASLCESTFEEMGRCDVLLNNAGVAMFGYMENTSLEDWHWVLDVNLWGVIHGCHFFYPRMIEQGGGGHIVNIASAAGLGLIPTQTAYCASKYGVVGFSETLRGEAALHGIGVTAICPSLVTTNIAKSVRWRMETPGSPNEQHLTEKSVRLSDRRNYSPDNVGERVVRAVEKNKGIMPVGAEAYLMDYAHRLAPSLGRLWQMITIKILQRTL
jgi:NADP-dependent 3-hydroxy acid dehydrogenase YdfG